MANTRSGNTWFVDTQHTVASDAIQGKITVIGVLFAPTAAAAVLRLHDLDSDTVKAEFRINTQVDTRFYDFSTAPLVFASGVKAKTLTNAVATLICREQG
jgi:hypothetical protein